MVVFRSNRELFVQLVDDVEGKTLVCVHSFGEKNGGNRESAVRMGTRVAKIAGEKDIDSIVFDRNGFSYQGRVKALAEAAREGGLRF
jgi:large subunit ribosomal protein L18